MSDMIDKELIEVVSREVARVQREKLKKEAHQKSVGRPSKKLYINKGKRKSEFIEETLESEVLEDELLKISQDNDVVEISNSDLHTFDEFIEGQEYGSEEIIEETNCSEEIVDDFDSQLGEIDSDSQLGEIDSDSQLGEIDSDSQLGETDSDMKEDKGIDEDGVNIGDEGSDINIESSNVELEIEHKLIIDENNKKELSEEVKLDDGLSLSNNVLYNFETSFSDMGSDFDDDDDFDDDFNVSFGEESKEILDSKLDNELDSELDSEPDSELDSEPDSDLDSEPDSELGDNFYKSCDKQINSDESQSVLDDDLEENKNNSREDKKYDLSDIKMDIKDNNDCNNFEEEEFKDSEDDRFKDCIYYKGMPVSEFLTKNKNYRESFYVEHFYSLEELKPLLKRGEIFLKKGKYKH